MSALALAAHVAVAAAVVALLGLAIRYEVHR